MNKPLGYYTSYTPGDDTLLEKMQEAWGSKFEALSNVERAWMIQQIAENLCADFCGQVEDDSVSQGVERVIERIHNDELTIGDQLRLIESLVNQIRS
jgi:hypothetical protein